MSPFDPERFSRQLLLPEIGPEGQKRLHDARVLVVGAGGLGAPLIHALSAAGVGFLRIVDFDTISLSNLNRQTLYISSDVGLKKAERAAHWVRSFYPECEVEAVTKRLEASHLRGIDLAIDAVDNYEARLLLDRLTEEAGIPLVHGAVSGWSGQVATFAPGKTRYRELFGEPLDEGETAPQVMGVSAQTIGSLEATEALKQLLGIDDNLTNKLLTVDLRTYDFQIFALS